MFFLCLLSSQTPVQDESNTKRKVRGKGKIGLDYRGDARRVVRYERDDHAEPACVHRA